VIHQIGWRANIENYLAIADINVFPSNREGLPVNLMESLAMGVPVITINSRGCRDIINDKENGIIIKDESIESLATAMKQLSDNSVLRSSLSKNGIKKRTDYDRGKYIEKQIAFYKQFQKEISA
jgi:glycosyltransferase involved in cell wall biosynthesis